MDTDIEAGTGHRPTGTADKKIRVGEAVETELTLVRLLSKHDPDRRVEIIMREMSQFS